MLSKSGQKKEKRFSLEFSGQVFIMKLFFFETIGSNLFIKFRSFPEEFPFTFEKSDVSSINVLMKDLDKLRDSSPTSYSTSATAKNKVTFLSSE